MLPNTPRSSTIRASEIGQFLYCRRAWWYAAHGWESENQRELSAGTALHEQHGRTVLAAGAYRVLGYLLLLAALVLLAVYLTNQVL